MNGSIINLSMPNDLFLWFLTVLIQATLLAGMGLLASRCAPQQPVIRHSILTATLLLIVIAPISTWLLQRAGYGVIAVAGQATLAEFEKVELPADFGALRGANTPAVVESVGAVGTDFAVRPESSMTQGNALANMSKELAQQQLVRNSAGNSTASSAQTLFLAESVSSENALSSSMQLWKSMLTWVSVLWLIGCSVMSATRSGCLQTHSSGGV